MAQTLTPRQLNRLENGREYRALTMAVRAADSEEAMIVEGYATTFGQRYLLWSDPDGDLYEQVASDAFAGCDMTDVIMQYDHEGRVFARTRNGTLTLAIDGIGLKITADLSGTDIGRQLYQEIKGGYTDRMSFGFTVEEDVREIVENQSDGRRSITRTITKIKKLYDVSAVSLPANDMTVISARRYADGVIGGIKAEGLERARKKKQIKILMEAM